MMGGAKQVAERELVWVVADEAQADVLAAFVAYLEGRDLSPATVRAYSLGMGTFSEWFERQAGKALDAVAVTPLDVRLFRDWLRDERRLSAATVNNYLAGVRSFCAWAVDQGLAPTNAAQGVRGVKVQESPPKWLGRQEQYQLLRACEEQVQLGALRAEGPLEPGNVWPVRDRAMVRLMLAAGLRRAEVCALNVADVVIRDRSGWVTVRKGKGGKEREVPLNLDARKALAAWLAVHPLLVARSETGHNAKNETGYNAKNETGHSVKNETGHNAPIPLFVSQKGLRRLAKRSLGERVTVLAEGAGLAGVHAHTLRHSCAKNLVDAGVGLEKVARILGHSNLETTLIYTQPSRQDLAQAVERVSWEDG